MMRWFTFRGTIILAGVLGLGLTLAATKARLSRYQASAPVAVARPERQEVVASPGAKKVSATFHVFNQGGTDLVLGKTTTSYGCTVAAIKPKVIRPDENGTILVESEPPPSGRRAVQIELETNAASNRRLILQLEVIGSNEPPFVSLDSGGIHFGSLRYGAPAREPFFVETLERPGTQPWIDRAVCSLPTVSVEGGIEREGPISNGLVSRRYSYLATIAGSQPPGAFRGDLILLAREHDPLPVLTTSINGNILDHVYSTPSSLYASLASPAANPELTVILSTADPAFDLEVEFPSETTNVIEVKNVAKQPGRAILVVKPTPMFQGSVAARGESITGQLIFKTNHPKCPSVEIPYYFTLD